MNEELNTPSHNKTEEITLKEVIKYLIYWFSYLKTQWLKITIVGFVGGVIGFFYASKQPITYTSKLTFVVEDGNSSGGIGGLASLAGQFGMDVGGANGTSVLSGENILLYFKSESLAREVLLSQYDSTSKQSIADKYAEVYKLKESWESNKKIGKVDFVNLSKSSKYSRLQDSLLQLIISSINKTHFKIGKTDKKASFIDVSTTMEDEVLAKKYCERIVDIAVERYISIKTKRQKTVVDKLQTRLDSISNLLKQKTLSGATLQTSSSTMDINPLYLTGTTIASETTVRDKTMLAAIFASVTQNLEIAKFTLSQETPVIQIVDSSSFPLKKEKVSKLKSAIVFSIIFGILFMAGLIFIKILRPR